MTLGVRPVKSSKGSTASAKIRDDVCSLSSHAEDVATAKLGSMMLMKETATHMFRRVFGKTPAQDVVSYFT